MARVLMIGAGGVATVAAFKIAQNADVFTEFMIASRRKVKCDQIVEAIKKKAAANPSLFTLHSSLNSIAWCNNADSHAA
jgi:saccharopine dehydrogenase (NAD+, L-lysine-forming)